MERLLLVGLPNPAGVAFLAQSLLDAERLGLDVLWLCHPDWTSVRPFWGRTLALLDQNLGGLPLRAGREASRARFPKPWARRGYTLLLLGMPYHRPQEEGPEAAAQARRRCQAGLAALAVPRRRIVHLHRHVGDRPREQSPGRVAHVSVSHQRCCHLDFSRRWAPLARLGAVANLAAEERHCGETWLRRARGLAARLAGGNWDDHLSEVVPRLCGLDWDFLESAELPALDRPQQAMVVLDHTVLLNLDGVPLNFRRHVLEEALQQTGRAYGVGILRGREGIRLAVVRRWRGARDLPPARTRLLRVVEQGGWVHPSTDHLQSPILSGGAFLDLLDEVVTTLEGQGGEALQSAGAAILSWAGQEILLGEGASSPVRLSVEAEALSGEAGGLHCLVRGDLGQVGHPLRLLLAGRLRPEPDYLRIREILSAYRRLLFPPGERGFLHRIRGNLASGGLGMVDPEQVGLVVQRIRAYLAETRWPWPRGTTGGSLEAQESSHLEALSRGQGDEEALLWILDTLGVHPHEVGIPPEGAGDLPACSLLQPRLPPAVIWPTTHLELLELALHNASEHGGKGPWPPLLVVVGTAEGPEVRIRDYGCGPAEPLASLLESIRGRGCGGLFEVGHEVERMNGVAWLRSSREGSTWGGRPAQSLRRRWLLVGEVHLARRAPEWLDLVRVPTPSHATRLAERQEAGAFDGMVLGPDVSASAFSGLAATPESWRWFELPRLALGAAGPGESCCAADQWLDLLASSPGLEVGWRLAPFH